MCLDIKKNFFCKLYRRTYSIKNDLDTRRCGNRSACKN